MDATPILSSASLFYNRARFASGLKTIVDVDALKPPWPYGRARHGASRPPPSPWRPPSGVMEHGGSIPADAEVPGPPHRRTIASHRYAMADACVDHGGNLRRPLASSLPGGCRVAPRGHHVAYVCPRLASRRRQPPPDPPRAPRT